MKKRLITLMITLPLGMGSILAQSIEPQVIGSMGDHSTSSGAMLSSTAGEVMIETVSSTNSIITQGFHQPDESHVGITESSDKKVRVNIYPNPTFNMLNLSITDQNQPFTVTIYNANGQLMMQKKYQKGETVQQYDITNWAEGQYMVRLVSQDQSQAATYKVQKLK